MAVAAGLQLCSGILTKLWLRNHKVSVRKLTPCIRWAIHRKYSSVFKRTKETQVAKSFSCQHRIPFTSTILASRSHISEQGSLSEALEVDPEKLVFDYFQTLFVDIREELQAQNHDLRHISNYYFDGKGKAIRPLIVMLMACALNSHLQRKEILLPSQYKAAMIVEMIHTATLIHDDVLDGSDLRRGKPSVNILWDHKPIIFAGDFVITMVALLLASLKNPEVTRTLSLAIVELVNGELLQLKSIADENERFAIYLTKTYKKTASLMANGCKAVALLAGCDEKTQEVAFQYGKNTGIAFQLVDDVLDFVATSAALGKPAVADLKLGIATAPVLFASQQFPEINDMIMRQFTNPGDIEKTLEAVLKSNSLNQTRFLAEQHCSKAVNFIQQLSPSPEQRALIALTDKVLNRMK